MYIASRPKHKAHTEKPKWAFFIIWHKSLGGLKKLKKEKSKSKQKKRKKKLKKYLNTTYLDI